MRYHGQETRAETHERGSIGVEGQGMDAHLIVFKPKVIVRFGGDVGSFLCQRQTSVKKTTRSGSPA